MPQNPRVFFDILIGSRPAGRVVVELFMDITPKTAENFRGLATGDYKEEHAKENPGKESKQKPMHYLNTQFHRIIDGFMV